MLQNPSHDTGDTEHRRHRRFGCSHSQISSSSDELFTRNTLGADGEFAPLTMRLWLGIVDVLNSLVTGNLTGNLIFSELLLSFKRRLFAIGANEEGTFDK